MCTLQSTLSGLPSSTRQPSTTTPIWSWSSRGFKFAASAKLRCQVQNRLRRGRFQRWMDLDRVRTMSSMLSKRHSLLKPKANRSRLTIHWHSRTSIRRCLLISRGAAITRTWKQVRTRLQRAQISGSVATELCFSLAMALTANAFSVFDVAFAVNMWENGN